MRIKCLLPTGYLDLSSQEQLQGETSTFRLCLRYNQIVEIPDELRILRNIDGAINSGYLQVLSYDDSDGSLVVNAELHDPYSTIRLNDLVDVNAPSPTNNQILKYDSTTQMWIPSTGGGGGTYGIYELLSFNITPVESPDGSNKKFTLPNSEKYIANKIIIYINGQVLNLEDFTEDVGRTFVTLNATVPAPVVGDNVRLHYVKEDSTIYSDIFNTMSTTSSLSNLMSFNVTPIGNINGSNKTFTLPSSEQYISNKIEVYLNGDVLNYEDYDQDVGNTSITLKSTVPAPIVGDKIRLNYFKLSNPYNLIAFHDSPVETPDGINKIFSLSNNCSYETGKISVMLNGLVLNEDDVKESLDNRKIIFNNSPKSGDNIRFYYISYSSGIGHDNNSPEIDSIPDNDHESSGTKITLIANEDQYFGDICYIYSNGNAKIANATVISTSSAIVMCSDNRIDANTSGSYLLNGIARNDSWSWTVGGLVYLTTNGTTSNTLSQTAPSATNNVIQIIGIATHADRIFFNPSLVQVEHI